MALSWWLWLLLGCVLLFVELITPGGFYIFFFGIGAILVALLSSAGFAGPAALQWLLFGVISAVMLLAFRKPLQRRVGPARDREIDTMIGETAVALGDIGVAQTGQALLRGTVWMARNTGALPIADGQRCPVERVHGLTLDIRG